MSKSSRYKGVCWQKGSGWVATKQIRGGKAVRGPFHFEEEAAFAIKVMAKAMVDDEEIPSTAEIKAMMPDLADGRERPRALREAAAR